MKKLSLLLALLSGLSFGIETGPIDSVMRVPHAGGRPKFGSVDLTKSAAVGSSILPGANGGTAVSSTATFPTSGVVVTEAASETLTNKVISGFRTNYDTANSSFAVGNTNDVLGLDASGGAFTATLPSAVSFAGKRYVLKKTDSSSNQISIGTTSSQTIDGNAASGYKLSTQHEIYALVSDGANWKVVNHYIYATPTLQTFTSSSGTYTTPKGVRWIKIRMVGGGGGGGGAANGVGAAGGGGGAGGYCEKTIVSPASTYSYSVGNGGAAGANSGTNGSAGQNTTFSTVTAGGGSGGTGSAGGPVAGGNGGTCSGGDLNVSGGTGSHGIDGNNGVGIGGIGGSGILSGTASGGTGGTGGAPGAGYGGGGGGAGARAGAGTAGAGSNSIIIVDEFY